MELWFVYSIVGYSIGAVAGTLDKHMMNQRYNPVTTVLFRTLFNGMFLGTAGFLLLHLSIPPMVLLFAAVPAFLLAISFVVYLGVLQRRDATEIQPFSQSLDTLFIFFASLVFLHEPVSLPNYLGIVLVVIGIYLVLTEHIRRIPQLDRNLLIIIALVPIDVAYALLVKTYLADVEPIALAVSIYLMAFLMLTIVSLLFRKKSSISTASFRPQIRIILIASLCAAAAAAFLYTALSQGNASKVYPMAGVSSIAVFFFATTFLKEHFHWHRFVGTIIVVAGIYLISL